LSNNNHFSENFSFNKMVETRRATHMEGETTDMRHEHPMEGKQVKNTEVSGANIRVRAGGIHGPLIQRARGAFFGTSTAQQYTILALAHAMLAVPLIFGCSLTTKFMFGKAAQPPDSQHCQLLNLYASGLLTSSSMLLALEELTRGNLLRTYTADILKMGLIAHSVAAFASMLLFPRTLSVGWVIIEGLAALATAALPASSMLSMPEDRSRVWRDIQNMPNWAAGALRFRGLPQRRFSWLAVMYNMLTVNFIAAGALYFIAPKWTLYHTFGYDYGASTHYLWRFIGTGALMTLLPAATMALKHKADIQRMSAAPARTLNIGLMGTSLGHLMVLGDVLAKGHGGMLLPALLGAWGGALFTSMLGLTAPEVTQMAEEVAAEAKRQ
jgi:hypothetical protein